MECVKKNSVEKRCKICVIQYCTVFTLGSPEYSTIYGKRGFSPNIMARLWFSCEIPYCHSSVYGMVCLQQSNSC